MLMLDKKNQLLGDLGDQINKIEFGLSLESTESPLDRIVRIEELKNSFTSLLTLKNKELIIFMMLNYEGFGLKEVRNFLFSRDGSLLPNYRLRKIESSAKRKIQRNLPHADVRVSV